MNFQRSFDAMLQEAIQVSRHGWNPAFIEGRWSLEQPPWQFDEIIARHLPYVSSLVYVDRFAADNLPRFAYLPPMTVAHIGDHQNSTSPLIPGAHRLICKLDNNYLPLAAHSTDLVVTRHTLVYFADVMRILKTGGRFVLTNCEGTSSNSLTQLLNRVFYVNIRGRMDANIARSALRLNEFFVLANEYMRRTIVFYDIGALIHYACTQMGVAYRLATLQYDRLYELHHEIETTGALNLQHNIYYFVVEKTSS